MKKRVCFKTNILESQALKNYLDDQLKEGWVLTRIGKRMLTFEKNESTNITYAVGIFEYMKTPGDEFKELVESFDYQYLGDRDGIVVFKSTSKASFYSDQLVDDEFKNIKMKKYIKRQFRNMCLALVLFSSFPAFSSGFISDILIYITLFLLVIILFKLNGDGGILSYYKYKRSGIEKTDYQGIEQRSWLTLLVFISFVVQIILFYLSGFKYENVSFIRFIPYCWIGILVLGCFFYHNRTRWLKAIEMSVLTVVLFITSFMFVLGNQHKPLSTTTKNFLDYYPYYPIEYSIDTYDLPFSLCHDTACQLVQNDVRESVLMKEQEVQEKMGLETYSYDYFEIKSTLFEEGLVNNIFKDVEYIYNNSEEQSFDDYVYRVKKYQYDDSKDKTYVDLIVRKKNEVYMFITLDYSSDENIKTFIQELPWKS